MRNTIYIGSLDTPDYTFNNDSTFSVSIGQKVSLVGQELSYDTLTVQVADDYNSLVQGYRFRSSDGEQIVDGLGELFMIDVNGLAPSGLLDLEYGTPIWYYNEEDLVGKFYLDSVTREGRNLYKLECVSAIGLLDKLQHGGGLFVQSTFGAVLAHILASGLHGTGNSVINYEIDDDVASVPVSGWLPYATKRQNLYQLVFAYGVNIIKNPDGNPRFTFVYTAPENPVEISTDIVFMDGGVTYEKPYSGVSVTEHTYTAVTDADSVSLFDNTNGAAVSNQEIWFSQAPVIVSTLTATGSLTVVSATENSAVLSGNGMLTGIPYTHAKHIVSATNPNVTEGKVIDVTECTMVNIINSDNLLNRLYAFYCPADKIKLIKGGFKQTDERCGKAYKFKNAFGEDEVAYLSKMDLSASSFLKANAEFYADYAPAGQAGLYAHVAVLVPTWDAENEQWVYTGTWEVPAGVTEFKVVMISGGTGGSSGYPGFNGSDAYAHTMVEQDADLSAIWYGAEGGDGGDGGSGGNPGKVKAFTVQNATPGDSYTYSLGQGGAGGNATGFRKDTRDELRRALENENPDTEYTDAQIDALIAQEVSSWNGTPNAGTDGIATTLTDGNSTWSTADNDSYVPSAGVYDPINGEFYALQGKKGINGGKGGARKIEKNGAFNWLTDGEDVFGADGTVYHGGSTGTPMTSVTGLDEARLTAYGGNGAGAAVGIDSANNDNINGKNDQSASWEVTTNGS